MVRKQKMTSFARRGHRHVALNITNRCNQRCVFCFEGERVGWSEPSLDEVKRLLELAAKTHDFVLFMGGEALLRKDICEIIRFGNSLELTLDVFTNGAVLARDGFVEQLADAGLKKIEISFHYADAESFAHGSGTHPKRFERLLKGLTLLRDHNRRSRSSAITEIAIETELFLLNFDKLENIAKLLEQTLAEYFINHRLGYLVGGPELINERLLAPFEETRFHLIAFLERHSKRRAISLSKIPLCLAPDFEHLALEPVYYFENTDVLDNFKDNRQIQPMHSPFTDYLDFPYRFLCSRCNFLSICPSKSCSWHSKNYAPSRSTKPFPEKRRTVSTVLKKAYKGSGPSPEEIEAYTRDWRNIPLPENAIIDSLYKLQTPTLKIKDIYCVDHPLFNLELQSGTEMMSLSLRLFSREGPSMKENGFLWGYSWLAPPRAEQDRSTRNLTCGGVVSLVEGSSFWSEPLSKGDRSTQIQELIQLISAIPLPPITQWTDTCYFDNDLSRLAQRVWELFGQKVWPGQAFAIGFTTKGLRAFNDGFVLQLLSHEGTTYTMNLSAPAGIPLESPPPETELWMASDGLLLFAPRHAKGEDSSKSTSCLDQLHDAIREIIGPKSAFFYPRDEAVARLVHRNVSSPSARSALIAKPSHLANDILVTFRDRKGEFADLTFVLAQKRERDQPLLELGGHILFHVRNPVCISSQISLEPHHKGFLACVKSIVRASKKSPPYDGMSIAHEILFQVRQTPIGRRFTCRVSECRAT